ncbi:MAG: phosphate-starvation-inducible PsiE family protein [Desulfotomaculales bacterium]
MAASEKPPVQAADGAPLLLRSMRFYNRLLHVFLGFSLIVASLLALWMFFYDVYGILFLGRGLLEGFLHALGTLLILWTISELISTEVRYLGGQRVQVAVFVDVAIAATLRKLLIGDIEGDGIEVKLVHLAALVALGLLR